MMRTFDRKLVRIAIPTNVPRFEFAAVFGRFGAVFNGKFAAWLSTPRLLRGCPIDSDELFSRGRAQPLNLTNLRDYESRPESNRRIASAFCSSLKGSRSISFKAAPNSRSASDCFTALADFFRRLGEVLAEVKSSWSVTNDSETD